MFTCSQEIIDQDIAQVIDDLGEAFAALAGKRILITGAGGFLGGYFVDTIARLNENFLANPCAILALDNFITGIPQRLEHLAGKSYMRLVRQDVTRPLSLDHDVDFIIHAASIASPTYYRRHPVETIDANVIGARGLLEYARLSPVQSFLLLSSSEIYGDPDPRYIPTPESYPGHVSCTGPRACYDEAKRLAETYSLAYWKVHRVPVKIIRPFNIYGPGLRLGDKRVIPDFIKNILASEPIRIFSDGRATRSFCYIQDAMRGMWQVLLSDCNGECFNVGNDQEEISVRELARALVETADRPGTIEYMVSEDKHYLTDNPRRRCPDLTKIKEALGYQPRVSLKEGLRRTLLWHELALKEGKNL